MQPATPIADTEAPRARLRPWRLFVVFSLMSLAGFGGVFPMAYRTLVERLRLLSHREFAATWAFGQMLPGSVIGNVATLVGHRQAGARGAAAAVLGLVMWPVLILLIAGAAYARYGELAPVRHALAGMAAAAVGLSMATAIKMARNLPRRWLPAAIVALVFIAIGLLRLPFLAVFAVATPLSVWLVWKGQR